MVGFNITISGNTYPLDMFEDADFKLSLSFAEIQDITKRNSTYSKSFYVPGSKHNNDVFQHFFNINASFTDYDVRKKMDAVLTYDGYEILSGYLRLEFVNVENTDVIYNLTFYSEFGNLIAGIGDKLMYDLDLSSMNHPYSATSIALDSFYDPDIYIPTGSTYAYQDGRAYWFFGHFGYEYTTGDTLNYNATPILAFNLISLLPSFDNPDYPLRAFYYKPSVSFKTLYEQIFSDAGYNIQSEFFDTAYFKRFYLPLTFNEDGLYLKQGSGLTYNSLVQDVGGIDFLNINWTDGGGSQSGAMERNRLTPTNTNNFSAHTTSDYFFSVPEPGLYQFNLFINAFNSEGSPETQNLDANFNTFLHEFSSPVNTGTTLFSTGTKTIAPGDAGSYSYTFSVYLTPGNYYALDSYLTGIGDAIITRLQLDLLNSPKSVVGDFEYNLEFPEDKFKQIEFIQAVNNLFNLVVVPSTEYSDTLVVEPMIDFIGTGDVIDWSNKIDRNQPIQISPTTNLINGSMDFTIQSDTDFGNESFFTNNNRIFGTDIINLNTDFPDNTIEFGSVFSSSVDFVMGNLQNAYATLPIFYVYEVEEDDGQAIQFFRPFASLMRPLFRGSTITGANLNTSNQSGTTITESWYLETNEIDVFQVNNRFTTYPFAVSGLSHYTNYTTTDFNDPLELQFTESESMYDIYYKDYVEDLIDPDSRILDCYVYLTRDEIKNITFKEKIVIDNNYYRINKIENYDISKDEPVLCQLIKLTRDYTPHRVKYYDLINCGVGSDRHTNTDLNYTMYQYVGNYISIDGDCFEVVEGTYNSSYTYERVEIPYSASTTFIPLVYTGCGCNTQIELLDIYDDYAPAPPAPSPSPTPSSTPPVTPSSTPPPPSATPTPSPTSAVLCETCYLYTIENTGLDPLEYQFVNCNESEYSYGVISQQGGSNNVCACDGSVSITSGQGTITQGIVCVEPQSSPLPTPTPSATPSSFSPSSIQGLTIWYDFDDTGSMTLSGSDIQAVNDKSGNNFHLSANAGSEPTLTTDLTYGGNNTAEFNGTTDEMFHYLSTTYTGMTGHSFFYVFKMTEISGSGQQAPFQVLNDVGGDEDRFWGTYYESTNRFRTHTDAMEANFQPYTTFTSQYPYVLLEGRVYDNGAGGSVVDVSMNDTSPSSTSTGAYDLADFNKIGVGGRVDIINNDEMLGNWGEFIFYDRTLTTTERNNVITYLKNKWNYTNW